MTQKCEVCGEATDAIELRKRKFVCPVCGWHNKVGAYARIEMVADKGSFSEFDEELKQIRYFDTEEYVNKVLSAREKTGLVDACVTGTARVNKEKIVISVCDTSFLMGSMGYLVGEKITRAVEYATHNALPVFIFCCSGGARMQEGIISLMQMEKTSAAMRRHDKAGLFSCTILTNPTLGGVSASFAFLGDIVLAEPGALVGFAGPRVIEQTIGKKLPLGFQTSEFQEKHGMIDGIIERKNLRKVMHYFVVANKVRQGYANFSFKRPLNYSEISLFKKEKVSDLEPWERVKLQRSIRRKSAVDYVKNIFDVFVELKGDRLYGDDQALVCGIAMLNRQPVTVIIGNRGVLPEEIIGCNYGMPMPEGYRKANRLMKQAEKFNRPIICFVNTPGGYCGVEAEERGQSVAIARNLFDMSSLEVPILSIITGEAGSGGALATAVANQVWMLENATYSIISPEGYASIVWKDSFRAEEAANDMNITAEKLKKLQVIDKVIPEYDGEEESIIKTSSYLRVEIEQFLLEMSEKDRNTIVGERYRRFRRY